MFWENKTSCFFSASWPFQPPFLWRVWHGLTESVPSDVSTSVPLSESFFTVNVFLFVPVNLVMPEMNLFQSGFLDAWLWREEFKQKPELLTIHQGSILYTELGFLYQACTLVYSIYFMQSLLPKYCSVRCLGKDFPCLCFSSSNSLKTSHLSH